MVDTRFHVTRAPRTLSELLRATGFDGAYDRKRADALVITGARELTAAGPQHIAFAAWREYLPYLTATEAGAVIVAPSLRDSVPSTAMTIEMEGPHNLFVALLEQIYPDDTREVFAAGMGGGAPALIEDGVRLGANVVIGPNAEIGAGSVIGAGTVIGAGVTIGRDCLIGPNCSIECAHLGNRVVLHAGARIGNEGFGWLDFGRSNRKIPQLGRVILQDGVEIGANTAVDRGALGDTVIGEGTKIDNLVQVGHNCRIGRKCLIAGHSALAGSTVVEDSVLFGAGAASSGHLRIGSGTTIYGRATVTKDIPAGSNVAGFPAEDVKQWRRGVATLRRLTTRDEA